MDKLKSNHTMQDYRDQLVNKLTDETNISEARAQAYSSDINHNEVFELLDIEPDQQALTAAENERLTKLEEEQKNTIKNARYEQLSKLSGAQRIAALLNSSDGDNSILPTSQSARLQAESRKVVTN